MTGLRLTEHARANMCQRAIPSAVVATTREVICQRPATATGAFNGT